MSLVETRKFRFTHVVPPLSEERQQKFRDAGTWDTIPKILLEERRSEEEGEIYIFSQPFGVLFVVSAFGGENIYTLHFTGGHFVNWTAVEQPVDSAIKVVQGPEYDRATDPQQGFDAWYEMMGPSLREAVKLAMMGSEAPTDNNPEELSTPPQGGGGK